MPEDDWGVDFEQDGLAFTLAVKHTSCGKTTRIPFERAAGAHRCGCGAEITFSSDDLRQLQKSLDGLKKLLG